MSVLRRMVLMGLMAGVGLRASDGWDPSFSLMAGKASLADRSLGQGTQFGLGLEGAAPLHAKGSLVLQGGWALAPWDRTTTVSGTVEARRELFYAGALYRYELPTAGVSAQGGLRLQSQTLNTRSLTASGSWLRADGERTRSLQPVLGVHARFTDKLSMECNVTRQRLAGLDGTRSTGTLLEFALGIHLD